MTPAPLKQREIEKMLRAARHQGATRVTFPDGTVVELGELRYPALEAAQKAGSDPYWNDP